MIMEDKRKCHDDANGVRVVTLSAGNGITMIVTLEMATKPMATVGTWPRHLVAMILPRVHWIEHCRDEQRCAEMTEHHEVDYDDEKSWGA